MSIKENYGYGFTLFIDGCKNNLLRTMYICNLNSSKMCDYVF